MQEEHPLLRSSHPDGLSIVTVLCSVCEEYASPETSEEELFNSEDSRESVCVEGKQPSGEGEFEGAEGVTRRPRIRQTGGVWRSRSLHDKDTAPREAGCRRERQAGGDADHGSRGGPRALVSSET